MHPILPIIPERLSLLPYTVSDRLQVAVSGNYLPGIAAVERPFNLFPGKISLK
jgi:hypothetical protein